MNTSTSPITGCKFNIPSDLNDKEKLNTFVEKNRTEGRKIVAVQGLGFVGSVMSLVVANSPKDKFAVIGVDLPSQGSYWKIASINDGEIPVQSSDNKVHDFFEKTKQRNNFYATYDSYAYQLSDIIIVDINLDVEKKHDQRNVLQSYDLSLANFKNGIESIAENCKEDALIVIETTVPPGTCEKVVKPILDNNFEERGILKKYKLAHSYERVMPGPDYIDSIINFYRVYSGIDNKSAKAAEDFLRSIIKTDEYPLTRLQSTNATEMAKVLENSYRAMNIAFIQEWTEFAESAGVNLFEVTDAIGMRPTHSNIMRPGVGVGGYCLTKDPLLASWARKKIFDGENLPQSETAVQINDQMPLHTAKLISNFANKNSELKNILILGVSYRSEVGDTRYTPVELLCKELENRNFSVSLHDPFINYWEEMERAVSSNLEEVIDIKYDAVILATSHSEYQDNEKLNNWITENPDMIIVDANKVLTDKQVKKIRVFNKLKIVGRGDL